MTVIEPISSMSPRTWWTCTRLKSKMGMDGRVQTTCLADAVLISSLTEAGLHAPCLDFDFPCTLTHVAGCDELQLFYPIPPTEVISWDKIEKIGTRHYRAPTVDEWKAVDDAMVEAGLIEGGYPGMVFKFRPGLPARWIPSTNPQHGHLYIDTELRWETYAKIINVMRDANLLQFNFANESINRKMTMLIRPGLTKADLDKRGIFIEDSK